MKKIREALKEMSTISNAVLGCCKDCDRVLILQEAALAEFDQIQERLESESLLEEVENGINKAVLKYEIDCHYSPKAEDTSAVAAQAAINTISKQLKSQ